MLTLETIEKFRNQTTEEGVEYWSTGLIPDIILNEIPANFSNKKAVLYVIGELSDGTIAQIEEENLWRIVTHIAQATILLQEARGKKVGISVEDEISWAIQWLKDGLPSEMVHAWTNSKEGDPFPVDSWNKLQAGAGYVYRLLGKLKRMGKRHDFLLWYGADRESLSFHRIKLERLG